MYITQVVRQCPECGNTVEHNYYHSYLFGKSTICVVCNHVVYYKTTPTLVRDAINSELDAGAPAQAQAQTLTPTPAPPAEAAGQGKKKSYAEAAAVRKAEK